MRSFLFSFLLILLFASTSYSQTYKPIDTADNVLRKENVLLFEQKTKEYISSVKEKYNKVGYKIADEFKGFSKDFVKEINDGRFVFDKRLNDYAKSVLNNLYKNNKDIPSDINILISKNNSLNAYCFPNNTFVINMGLFYWLDNEEQLAAVLSHELAHKILEHSTKTKKKRIEDSNSKQTEIERQTLAKTKYGKSDYAFQLYKAKLYTTHEESRRHEFEADSLGYEIYRKSDYAKSEFIDALNLMVRYDTIKPKGLRVDVYKQFFDLPSQKFDEKWLLKEDFSQYNYDLFKEKIDKDSISSHPETLDRIAKIKALFPESAIRTEHAESKEFEEVSNICKLEIVPNYYNSENYGDAIYVCLLFLQTETKQHDYYKKWLGICFQKIYEGRKNYTLNRYLDRIDPKEQSESYQQFLNFVWNLRLNEIKEIADYYSK
jgi:Zn-dependent protease with chaperone function